MAKRFTDTEKWKDPWFCSLSCEEKGFWGYLLDTCDLAGIWQVNWPLVRFYMPNFVFKKEVFGDRIKILSDEKWFIPKFIGFQYGELNPANRLHQAVASRLTKEGVYKPLTSPLQGAKDKDKVLDKVKKDRGVGEGFARFWMSYPKKVGKGAAEKAWERISGIVGIDVILAALEKVKRTDQWTKESGKFIPYPATWLNQKRWEDEVPTEKREEVIL